jgi:ethanolamine utilization protein EutQ (cupin superfamily)
LVTAKTDDEKTKNTFDANFIEQIHKAQFEKRLTKTQVEEIIEEDSALDSVRNLSIAQDEVGAGHQEDTSLSMEEEKEEVPLSPNKETSPP